MSDGLILHPDNKSRCWWPGTDPFYVEYHDTEWGVPEYDDRALFEKLILDGFQAGLSWITILRKRENFRKAFDDFEPKEIAFKTTKSVPAATEVSIAISKDLGKRGFKFVGPTIVYAFMQATGMVNDHLVDCHCHATCGKTQRKPRVKAK